MAGTRRFVKVFLASPKDLAEERKAAKQVVDEYNGQLASEFGYQVDLVGWEDTLPGVGRPQEIINRDLDGCDLFVGILWKRWGTPPGAGPYTSGFEEEFERSVARHAKEGKPQINLLFKDVDTTLEADPGDQLKKVLAFKQRVFDEKRLFVSTFSDVRDFESKFRRCVHGYVIALRKADQYLEFEKDQTPTVEKQAEPPDDPKPTTPLSVNGAKFLRRFLRAAEGATYDQPLVAEEVARFRLLAKIARVHRNDELVLGAHDANLLFKASGAFDFGQVELNGLIDDALEHFQRENVPLWKWVSAIGGFESNSLPIRSIVGSTDQRVGALKAMRLVTQQPIDTEYLTREKVVSIWLSRPTETPVRVAALEFLADHGLPCDLPFIQEEFDRNETPTVDVAADAIIRIQFRGDRRDAFDSLLRTQSSVVRQDLLDMLFAHDVGFENEKLARGLSHRNAQVRVAVIRLLQKRRALTENLAEPLLDDGDAEVRYLALQALRASGRTYSIEQAKAVLIRPGSKPVSFGLFATASGDREGEAVFERYAKQQLTSLTDAQLEEKGRSDVFENSAYFAMIRRDFANRSGMLRADIADRFVTRFQAKLDELTKTLGSQTPLIDEIRGLEARLRSKFTREGLDIVCSRLDAIDLPLVRATMLAGEIDYSSADLRYLAKYGQWCDVPLVIASVDRPEHNKRFPSLLSISSSTKYEDSAQALLSIGRDRLSELLATRMPSHLLVQVLRLMSDRGFATVSAAVIGSLMRAEAERVRKVAALRFVRAFPRRRVKQFLEEYVAADTYYYNVAHWLDFGVSVPRDRMMRAAQKALLDL